MINSVIDLLDSYSNIQYDNFTSEEDYIVRSPDQVLEDELAVCYDMVELERRDLERLGLDVYTFFAYERLPIYSSRTHTFLIFEDEGEYYWLEYSWAQMRGLHGCYRSLDQALEAVKFNLRETSQWKTVRLIEYSAFDYRGMNLNEFGEHVVEQDYLL